MIALALGISLLATAIAIVVMCDISARCGWSLTAAALIGVFMAPVGSLLWAFILGMLSDGWSLDWVTIAVFGIVSAPVTLGVWYMRYRAHRPYMRAAAHGMPGIRVSRGPALLPLTVTRVLLGALLLTISVGAGIAVWSDGGAGAGSVTVTHNDPWPADEVSAAVESCALSATLVNPDLEGDPRVERACRRTVECIAAKIPYREAQSSVIGSGDSRAERISADCAKEGVDSLNG